VIGRGVKRDRGVWRRMG